MADIFQEVDEDLRRDKALAFWKRYQNHIIGFAIIAIAATAGFSGWRYYKQQKIEANGAAYLQALQTLEKDPKAAMPQFEALAKDGGGFAVLAQFQQANQTLKDGDKAKAAEQFAAIAQDGAVDKALKDLAAVLGGLAFLDAGKPADAAKLVEPLTGDDQPYRFSALEVQAQAALAGGDRAKAKKLYEQLKQLSALPNAPQGVSARAEIMLQRLQD
ncbi:tetratricopeptide repeat protein [Dongia sedimenti]|uniref:Tetratricopeptide repeat protein n=1 Tax=Dongia sedimenti TaxID=3064282 RepID=A0ABU0YX72_9PROT|nr:tetratricopeptide repeat protein [Rhodospirillaceae bacterium R-7]